MIEEIEGTFYKANGQVFESKEEALQHNAYTVILSKTSPFLATDEDNSDSMTDEENLSAIIEELLKLKLVALTDKGIEELELILKDGFYDISPHTKNLYGDK